MFHRKHGLFLKPWSGSVLPGTNPSNTSKSPLGWVDRFCESTLHIQTATAQQTLWPPTLNIYSPYTSVKYPRPSWGTECQKFRQRTGTGSILSIKTDAPPTIAHGRCHDWRRCRISKWAFQTYNSGPRYQCKFILYNRSPIAIFTIEPFEFLLFLVTCLDE